MTLILTEKGTQAQHLSAIMDRVSDGEYGLKKGIYEGIEFLICPLSGHILQADQSPVDLYNFVPPTEILKRIPDMETDQKKKVNQRVKYVQQRFFGDIDSIILATDPDMEGCSIAKEVLDFYKLDSISDITYMDISNTSAAALKKALNRAITTKKDHLDWERFAFAAMLKSDFSLTGLAATHSINKIMKDHKTDAFYTFGTQQIRALDLVVERYRENRAFDRSKHYRIKAHTDSGVFVFADDGDTKDKRRVDGIADRLNGGRLNVVSMEKSEEEERSPKWYDGSQLGSSVAKDMKMSIQEIFSDKNSIMQGMYERGLITYIRGEAKGKMPMVDFDMYAEVAKGIAGMYGAKRLDTSLVKPYLWRKDDSKEKVNHTPCTLADIVDVTKFKGAERSVLDFAAKQILATFYPDARIVKYSAVGQSEDGLVFVCEDKETLDIGWKEIYGQKPYTLNSYAIRDIRKGDTLRIKSVEVEEYTKTPPPLFTETSLLDAIKKKGIGSESTFGEIINFILDRQKGRDGKVIRREYCRLNDKKQIIPTDKGMTFVDTFPEKLKGALKLFEGNVLKLYIDGEMDENEALKAKNKISAYLYGSVLECFKGNIVDLAKHGKEYKTYEKKEARETSLTCPLCKKHKILDKDTVFQCSGSNRVLSGTKWVEKGCSFSVFKESKKGYRYTLTEKNLSDMIENNMVQIKAYSEKSSIEKEVRLKFKDDYSGTEIITL